MLFHHFLILFIMKSLSPATHDHIITMLQSGVSGNSMHHATDVSLRTISKLHSQHCFVTPKSLGGHPIKLTSANITYAKHLIHMQKADNAVQVTKSLVDVTNQSILSQTVRHSLCKAGIRSVVKKKHPLLKLSHRRERLYWAERHKEYTPEDWKRVV